MPRRRRGSLTFFEPRRAHARVSVSAEAPAVAVTAGASRYALDLSAAFLRALLRGLSTTFGRYRRRRRRRRRVA